MEEGKSRLGALMGAEIFDTIAGKTVIDFGCGEGVDAVEMAVRGAKRVIGIDIREEVLRVARYKSLAAGIQSSCSFVTSTQELADVVVSVDALSISPTRRKFSVE